MDPNELMAQAERAYRNRAWNEARQCLLRAQQLVGGHAAILHLLALVEKEAGRLEEAAQAFQRASTLAPGDGNIANNYANFLLNRGDDEAALTHFARAVHAAPNNYAARINRAMLLRKIGRLEAALEDIELVLAHEPQNIRALSAKGGVLHAMGRVAEAARAFETVLAIDPTRPIAIRGRARTALEQGEPSAVSFYEQALKDTPGDRELILGLAQALDAAGDRNGEHLLGNVLGEDPTWLDGLEVLARMRHEAGQPDFARCHEAALRQAPGDEAINLSYWEVLRGADQAEYALHAIEKAKLHLPSSPATLLAEAVIASEAGDRARALKALAPIETMPEAALTSARLALQAGQPDRAAGRLEAAVAFDRGDTGAWAHLGLAWRLLGDARFDWLCMQDGLVSYYDLPFSPAQIKRLAALLRDLHRTQSHPIGQSLRGGTQTRGRLFWRKEPELQELSRAIDDALQSYQRKLPCADENHPLLRHRESSWRFGGSWSVRLTNGGFHVSHIHPQGVVSSAFYVSLPDDAGMDDQAGWLELGRPPAALKIALEPLIAVQPKPSRLGLFPSYFFHGTRPFERGERLTVAFDVEA